MIEDFKNRFEIDKKEWQQKFEEMNKKKDERPTHQKAGILRFPS